MTRTQASNYNRWMLILRAVISVIIGIVVLALPGLTLITLVYLLGAFILVDGIIAVVAGFLRPYGKWSFIVGGILAIIIGLMVFFWPGITAIVLLYLIAAWAIVSGIAALVTAFSLGAAIGQEWLLAIAGAILLLFGLFLLFRPGAGILSLLWLLGAALIAYGVLLFIRAFIPRQASTSPM
ncbi:MAG: HdeD family acid-resistance protein [Ktedonobacteraceae bacterium]